MVPWIIVMSHFPFYCTGCYAKQMASKYYARAVTPNGRHGNANATAQLFAQKAGAKGPRPPSMPPRPTRSASAPRAPSGKRRPRGTAHSGEWLGRLHPPSAISAYITQSSHGPFNNFKL